MDEEETTGDYAWQSEYKRSWDMLEEDEQGSLKTIVNTILLNKRRKRLHKENIPIQRGIIRHLFLVVDLSKAMAEVDLKPTRVECTLSLVELFITEFFDQNPLSCLGIIITRDGLVERISEMHSNPVKHIEAIKKKVNREPRGEPSLQNSLELAKTCLGHVPQHCLKEILVIFASLTTCDPGNIFDTLKSLKKERIRVSVVGLMAEVQICKTFAQETNGTYGVVINETHFKDLLFKTISPPPMTVSISSSSLVQMGFPKTFLFDNPTFCACHTRLTRNCFECPRCYSKVCDIPTECPICGLTLVSSPLLARSYHHLFPLQNFVEVNTPILTEGSCFGCQITFPIFEGSKQPANSTTRKLSVTNFFEHTAVTSGRFECKKCLNKFCLDCDIFIHDVLHNCPGC
ncbi:hypothetical protein HDU92_004559 [Lobulomyces angularis]|nr:hypothetical protein HDU92_004559 [Lobulomyces angularis]